MRRLPGVRTQNCWPYMPSPGAWRRPRCWRWGMTARLVLFSYLALLNGGTLLLLALHPWTRLAWAALLGTAFYYIGWTVSQGDASRLLVTGCFLGLFFAVFAAVPILILRKAN